MPILNIVLSQAGVVDVVPSFAYIATNDTLSDVLAVGYLNKAAQQGYAFSESMAALVSTKPTPNSTSTQVRLYDIVKSGENWSLEEAGGFANIDGNLVAGNLVQAADENTIQDAGIAISHGLTAAYAGGGTSNIYAASGVQPSSDISAVIRASTNAVAIAKAVPGTDTITVTFTADPGAGTTVNWIAVNIPA